MIFERGQTPHIIGRCVTSNFHVRGLTPAAHKEAAE